MSKIRQTFAKKLKYHREKKKLTQEGLAEILGISVRYVQHLEGKNPPNVKLDTIEAITQALKIKPKDLL